MEVVSGFVASTTGSGTPDPVVNGTGDTTAIRSYAPGSQAWILNQWATDGTGTPQAVVQQVKSPRMHDNVNGIQTQANVGPNTALWSAYARELVYPQDVLSVNMIENGGGGTGPIAESLLMFYADLPGSDAKLARWAEIAPRIEHQMGVQVALTSTGATAGDYDAPTVITTTEDQFKANRWYAILGFTCDVELATVGIRSPDFANYRVGGPGSAASNIDTREWFIEQSEDNGLPCIPCFNAANKFATVVDVIDPNGNLPGVVTLLCALLRGQ